MPSNSAKDKIRRAEYQIDNARKLIASLPTRYIKHKEGEKIIRYLSNELFKIVDEIQDLEKIAQKLESDK